jgi:hypothetical protein
MTASKERLGLAIRRNKQRIFAAAQRHSSAAPGTVELQLESQIAHDCSLFGREFDGDTDSYVPGNRPTARAS